MTDGPRPENAFPTIADLHATLSELIGAGFGDLAVQVLVVPDSTIQALASHPIKPAIMVEYLRDAARLPVSLITTDRWSRNHMPSVKRQ